MFVAHVQTKRQTGRCKLTATAQSLLTLPTMIMLLMVMTDTFSDMNLVTLSGDSGEEKICIRQVHHLFAIFGTLRQFCLSNTDHTIYYMIRAVVHIEREGEKQEMLVATGSPWISLSFMSNNFPFVNEQSAAPKDHNSEFNA